MQIVPRRNSDSDPDNTLLSIMAPTQDVDSEHQQMFLSSCVMPLIDS